MPDPLSPARTGASRLQQLVIGLGVVASSILAIVAVVSIQQPDLFATLDFVVAAAAAVSLAATGAVLVWRLPAHPVGWLLWIGGCLFALASGGEGIADAASASNPTLAAWLVIASESGWVPGIICITALLPMVFPTGRLPSPRWRVLVAIAIAAAICNVIQTVLAPFDPGAAPAGVTNPVGASGTALDIANLLGSLSSATGVVFLPIVAGSLALRFRRSAGVERAQLKWLAAAIAMTGPALAFGIVVSRIDDPLASFASNVGYLVGMVGLALLPVAIGIAVLRYRLYEIDLIIRRTVVYVPLTAILAGLYAATTALLQRLFIAATGERSDGAIIASTLILATLFTPIKGWLQAIVDRRFRDQLDAKRELEAFVQSVATAVAEPDPARTLRAFLGVAIHALDATGGRAWLDRGTGRQLVAARGAMPERGMAVDVETSDRHLGTIELGPRTHGKTYRAGEPELLAEVARALAAAIADPATGTIDELAPTAAPAPAEVELSSESTVG